MKFSRFPCNYSVLTCRYVGLCVLGMMFWSVSAGAADQAVPWECTGFTGEAQSRCTRTFTALQREKIAKLEKALEFQKQETRQYQQQLAQQASTTAKLQRKLTRKRSRWYHSPSLHIFPSLGLGLHFGRDRFFGGSLFYGNPRYDGPRFYRHGYRRWHRH